MPTTIVTAWKTITFVSRVRPLVSFTTWDGFLTVIMCSGLEKAAEAATVIAIKSRAPACIARDSDTFALNVFMSVPHINCSASLLAPLLIPQ